LVCCGKINPQTAAAAAAAEEVETIAAVSLATKDASGTFALYC
jgi:hypothetical protein